MRCALRARAAGLARDSAPPSLLPLAALLLPPRDVADTVQAACTLPPGAARLAVRSGGRNVKCVVSAEGTVALHTSAVPVTGGCLLVEGRGGDGERMNVPRAVVASSDAALVKDLNGAYARGVLPEHAMQALLHVLGDALSPRAAVSVRCAAGRAAACAGLGATLRALCEAAERSHVGGGAVVAVAASPHVRSPACIAALHGVAPPAAWAEAARWLRVALGDDALELPHCAAFIALTAAKADAAATAASVRLLAAMHTVLLHSAEDDVDIALDAEDNAAEAAAFHAFRARSCAQAFFVSHALGLLAAFMRLYKAASMLPRTSWPSDAELGTSGASLLRDFRLHPLQAGLPVMEPRDVPWPSVQNSLRMYIAFSVLFAMPFQLVAFIQAWRLLNGVIPSPRWYYGVFCYWFWAAYIGGHLVCDLCIMAAADAAPEWPAGVPTVVHALFVLMVWSKALFEPRLVHVTMAWTIAAYFMPLLLVVGPTAVFSSPSNVLLTAAMVLTAARAGPRERALRAGFAATLKVKQA